MRLAQLAQRIGAQVIVPGRPASVDIEQVYAGDRISDLLNAAGDHTLLISNLAGAHLLRVAELMDIPGLCLVNQQLPDEAMQRTAAEHGTLLMVAAGGLFETCGRIHQILSEEARSAT
jgi:hypothetical protein